MTTMLEDHATHWVVKTVDAPGRRKRMGRLPVAVAKGDLAALTAEIEKQATALRASYGIELISKDPVV